MNTISDGVFSVFAVGCGARASVTLAGCVVAEGVEQDATRDQLIEMSRRYDNEVFDRAVDVQILRLRRKLGWSDPDESPIESVRGFGYRYRRSGGDA